MSSSYKRYFQNVFNFKKSLKLRKEKKNSLNNICNVASFLNDINQHIYSTEGLFI